MPTLATHSHILREMRQSAFTWNSNVNTMFLAETARAVAMDLNTGLCLHAPGSCRLRDRKAAFLRVFQMLHSITK